MGKPEHEERARELKQQRAELKKFFDHLGSFVSVNLGLFVIDWLTGGGWWFYWPLLGWGIGLVSHGVSVWSRPKIDRLVHRFDERELEQYITEKVSKGTAQIKPFTEKLKAALDSDSLKQIGEELSGAMRELEHELGEMGGFNWEHGGAKGKQVRRDDAREQARPQAAGLPEGLTVLMFTDLAGFTTYVEREGDEAGHALLKQHNRVLKESVARHDGIEVKNLGDGAMLCFVSVRKALACAAEIQARLGRERFPLPMRIGLHAGEPIRAGEDMIGRTVNVAARVMDQADGGQILVTGVIRNLAGAQKGFQYVDQGLRRLPGLTDPVHLYAYQPIEPLSTPLDSAVDSQLDALERRVQDG